jgi:hypothetical protein
LANLSVTNEPGFAQWGFGPAERLAATGEFRELNFLHAAILLAN